MKVYVVIDRVDGEIDGVYMNKADADAHAEEFGDSDMYRMAVEEYVVQPKLDWKG